MQASEKGLNTEARVAQAFGLRLEHDQRTNQYEGVDAYSASGKRIQVKHDDRILKTGNVYVELGKRPFSNDASRSAYKPFRAKPWSADAYVFVCGSTAFLAPVEALLEAMVGEPVTQIRETSIGVLIPLAKLRCVKVNL